MIFKCEWCKVYTTVVTRVHDYWVCCDCSHHCGSSLFRGYDFAKKTKIAKKPKPFQIADVEIEEIVCNETDL